MKLLLAVIIIFLTCSIGQRLMAQVEVPDTLLTRLSERTALRSSFELGQFDIQTYTYGTSQCLKSGLLGRLFPHILPFQASKPYEVAFEGYSHAHYQWPGDMHINISAYNSNLPRTGRTAMRQLFRAILPLYAVRRYRDYESSKSFILPFYDEGSSRYHFELVPMHDSLLHSVRQIGMELDTNRLCCIRFSPLRHHHTMLQGRVLVDSVNAQVLAFDYSGRLDMATFRSQMFFLPADGTTEALIPHSSHIDIDYQYLGTHGRNSYDTRFRYMYITPLDSLDRSQIPLDLTPYYADETISDSTDFELMRPVTLPSHIDSIIHGDSADERTMHRRRKRRIETFSETLVDGSRLGTPQNRLRIYGPLDPASVGYDNLNGITLREQARWNYRFKDNSELYVRGEIGYAFKLRELRYRLLSEWTYLPQRRGRFTLEVRRTNSNFSSKFINTVNDALAQETGKVNFDSLGLDYFQRYEFTLEHSIELTNGLMLHAGIIDTYRNPVKHGVRRIVEEHRQELIDAHYSDFAPFVRLEWTPRQYYWYDRGYKTYIHSPAPTFSIELSRAIPGVLKAESNYGRAEFDMHQSIRLSRTQRIAYHTGFGKFFNQRGEYFINYRFFARSQYPSSWDDDRIGGAFHLLDDYWYASSPSYIQAHYMHETPFGLLHLIRPISRFIIKERLYLSALWSEGKSFYNEWGYGIDNNYFNVGFFVGFKDLNYYSAGVKFRVEIGHHL